MDAFFIVAATVVAILLVLRIITPPRKPDFYVAEHLPTRGLISNVSALGKACAVTERGKGVSARRVFVRLKRIINKIERKSGDVEMWKNKLVENKDILIAAADRARKKLRRSYLLGHVRELPRIFLLCREIAVCTRGFLDMRLLTDLCRRFSVGSPLTVDECGMMGDMTVFCLCGMICAAADSAISRERVYARGKADGEIGRIDLDRIKSDEYICGICETSNIDAVLRIAENNGIDTDSASASYRVFLAEVFALISGAADAVKTVFGRPEILFYELSAVYGILKDERAFTGMTEKERVEFLKDIARTAKKRKIGEAALAAECVDYAAVTGCDLSGYIRTKPKNRYVARYILPMFAAVVSSVLLCVFSPSEFNVFYILISIVIFTAFTRLVKAFLLPNYAPRDVRLCDPVCVIASKIMGISYLKQRLDTLDAVGNRLNSRGNSVKGSMLYAKLLLECIVATLCSVMQLFGVIFVSKHFAPLALTVVCSAIVVTALIGLYNCGAELSFKPLRSFAIAAAMAAFIPSSAVLTLVTAIFNKPISKLEERAEKRLFVWLSAFSQTVAAVAVVAVASVYCPPMIAFGCVFAAAPAIPLLWAKINKSVSERGVKTSKTSGAIVRTSDHIPCEIFGGETKLKLCMIDNGNIYVVCDNRGSVFINVAEGACAEKYRFGLTCASGMCAADLSRCYGVFQNHRAVYRYVGGVFEITAEITVPIGISACVCRLGIVNRTNKPISVELSSYFAPEKSTCETKRTIAIFLNGVTETVGCDEVCLAKTAVSLGAFEKKAITVAAAFCADVISASRVFGMTASDLFFEHAAHCAQRFAVGKEHTRIAEALSADFDCADGIGDPHLPTLVFESKKHNIYTVEKELSELKKYGYSFNAYFIEDRADYGPSHRGEIKILYSSREREKAETVKRIAVNNIRRSREVEIVQIMQEEKSATIDTVQDTNRTYEEPKLLGGYADNEIADDKLYCVFDRYGAVGGKYRIENTVSELPRAFIALGESGAVWSPTVRPCGHGELSARHLYGHSEFMSVFNGISARLRTYAAHGAMGIIYDLLLENHTDKERDLSVMIAADVPKSYYPVRTSDILGGLMALSKTGGMGFALFSSDNIAERAAYKQAYFSRGKIDRTSGFRRGGSDAALALSVNAHIRKKGSKRIVFLLAAKAGELLAGGIDINAADGYFERETAYYKKMNPIGLNSSDDTLNMIYSDALYRAYTHAARCDVEGDVLCALASSFAVKYADADIIERRIMGACAAQNVNGGFRIDASRGSHAVLKTLLLPLAAIDHAEFIGDRSIFTEKMPFASDKRGVCAVSTVLEHCLAAIDAALNMLCTADAVDTAALYSALCLYVGFCGAERKRRYRDEMKKLWFVGNCKLGDTEKLRKLFDSRILFETVNALSLYESGDPSAAYSALGRAMTSGKESITDSYVASTMFYYVVTEKLLGISVHGDKAEVYPRTADITPHIEFSVSRDGAVTRIAVDDSTEQGEWKMSVGRISYSNSKLNLRRGSDGVIILKRCDDDKALKYH